MEWWNGGMGGSQCFSILTININHKILISVWLHGGMVAGSVPRII